MCRMEKAVGFEIAVLVCRSQGHKCQLLKRFKRPAVTLQRRAHHCMDDPLRERLQEHIEAASRIVNAVQHSWERGAAVDSPGSRETAECSKGCQQPRGRDPRWVN